MAKDKTKNEDTEVVYFEINNWYAGVDYPDEEPFIGWLNVEPYGWCLPACDLWVKENGLVVSAKNIDMSLNFCITAPKAWVEKNCPSLLEERNAQYVYSLEEGDVVPAARRGVFYEYREPYIGKIIWDKSD